MMPKPDASAASGNSGEPEPFSEKRAEDHDAVERWARAEGVHLENEAQRAKQKLLDVGRRLT